MRWTGKNVPLHTFPVRITIGGCVMRLLTRCH